MAVSWISRSRLTWVGALGLALVLPACAAPGPRVGGVSSLERSVTLQRRSAGLRIGTWRVRDLQEIAGSTFSETPLFEGYFQRGLDLHLALGSTMGLWRRTQEVAGSGKVTSYIVPAFTSLKIYPLTRPEQRFEPYIDAGIGGAIGIDDREGTAGGPLGETEGTDARFGFGFKGGGGVEWRFSRAFGLSLGGRYQWIRFGSEVGGDRTFQGLGFDAGLTYRFQYD